MDRLGIEKSNIDDDNKSSSHPICCLIYTKDYKVIHYLIQNHGPYFRACFNNKMIDPLNMFTATIC